jgi:hypothetical protein
LTSIENKEGNTYDVSDLEVMGGGSHFECVEMKLKWKELATIERENSLRMRTYQEKGRRMRDRRRKEGREEKKREGNADPRGGGKLRGPMSVFQYILTYTNLCVNSGTGT